MHVLAGWRGDPAGGHWHQPGAKKREAPPLRPRGPIVLLAATGPSTDKSSNGHGRRKDPAQ